MKNIFSSPFKKKQPQEPTWRISTKVISQEGDHFSRSRKNKIPFSIQLQQGYLWIKNYFKTVGWIFLLCIFGVGTFSLFATPLFQLNPDKIEIVLKPEPVFDTNAIRAILGDYVGKNIFTISTRDVFDSLSESIRHIASVEKTVLLPDGIRVTVTSFSPSYRAFLGEEKYLLTENGQLIPDIPEHEVPNLEIYHLVSDTSLGRRTPLTIETMTSVREILAYWRKNLPDYAINSIKLYDQEQELHIVSSDTRFIISLGKGVSELHMLVQILSQEGINISRQLYIDLRVPNRIYSCPKEESVCAGNISQIYEN